MWNQFLSSTFYLRRVTSATTRWMGSVPFAMLPLLVIAPSTAFAQTAPTALAQNEAPAPTARYAQGEDVDLSEIVAEWRGYYVDVPIYLCVCQDGTCDQTAQWPYREYDRYQLSVALGPTKGQETEANGFNCFDIADRSRPSNPRDFSTAEVGSPEATTITPPEGSSPPRTLAGRPAILRPASGPNTRPGPASATSPPTQAPQTPPQASPAPTASSTPQADTPLTPPPPAPVVTPPTPPAAAVPTANVPTVTVINAGAGIRLDWPSGSSNVINVTDSQWNINVLNALDCESLSVVEQKTMTAERVQGTPVVNSQTGYVAVPVLLDSCVDTDQMGVFVLNPAEDGSYALYRTQLPEVRGPLSAENRSFPNELSSYAYSTIVDMRYWDSSLLVRHGSASSAEAILIFRPGRTPAGFYAGCAVVNDQEGASVLCDQE